MYPNLSDEELIDRLSSQAAARDAGLVEEQEAGKWHVAFMRFKDPGNPEPERGGASTILKAESPDLRDAREALLYQAENP